MEEKSLAFLKDLLDAPSASGYEQPAQRVWRAYMSQYADRVTTDLPGHWIGVESIADDHTTQGIGQVRLHDHPLQIGGRLDIDGYPVSGIAAQDA